MIHELKTNPECFEDVISGKKTFEVRENDRDFKTGDLLALNEYNPEKKAYTGRSALVYVDYACTSTRYVREGFAVMSIKPCSVLLGFQCEADDYVVPLAPIMPTT